MTPCSLLEFCRLSEDHTAVIFTIAVYVLLASWLTLWPWWWRLHITEGSILHSHRWENLRFNIFFRYVPGNFIRKRKMYMFMYWACISKSAVTVLHCSIGRACGGQVRVQPAPLCAHFFDCRIFFSTTCDRTVQHHRTVEIIRPVAVPALLILQN
jgi:hypothetical protein